MFVDCSRRLPPQPQRQSVSSSIRVEVQMRTTQRRFTGKIFMIHSCCLLLIGSQLMAPTSGMAEWSVSAESYLFYTDDAALFSSTRRLARNQDPTQPIIDRPLAEQGEDVVYEPAARVTKSFGSPGSQTEVSVRGQGFLFADNGRFNHGTLGVQVTQELSAETKVGVRYFYGPDLFLGKNEVRAPVVGPEEELKDEKVTTHFWSGGIAHRVHEDLTIILYGRYGLRRYTDAFDQRNTDFWTIGTHLEWEACDHVELALGYHYERGLADGRKQPLLKDDISYFNHFVTAELTIELLKELSLEFALDYERNSFTTGIAGDERDGEHEDVVSGDISLVYELTDAAALTTGFQGAHRKESFEEGLRNLNVWFGGRILF